MVVFTVEGTFQKCQKKMGDQSIYSKLRETEKNSRQAANDIFKYILSNEAFCTEICF